MAVEKIEEYRQQNGTDILKVILKPTKKFPVGYFYAPADARSLVENYSWHLTAQGRNRICVIRSPNVPYQGEPILFHIKLFEYYNNYTWQGHIDHQDHIEYDNIDENLEPVTPQQNKYNIFSRGYIFDTHFNPAIFRARIVINGRTRFPFENVRREDEACNIQNYTEQVWLREQLGNEYYMFDFKKYRRGSTDILDLERTGKISEEEAMYRHISKYANNAWYYYRYGLQEYFKQYHIPIPEYRLNEYGFMVHPVTGQRLCPF